MNMLGEQGLPLNIFFLTARSTLERSWDTSSINLGLSSVSANWDISLSLASSSTGLTRVKQSLFLKKLTSSFLMLFFLLTKSELPFCCLRAFYRYSWGDMVLPSASSRRRAKSLSSHRKLGKQFITVDAYFSPPFCSILLKLMTRLKLCTARSSIFPRLL